MFHIIHMWCYHGNSGSDGLVKVWTIRSNECVATLDQHTEKVEMSTIALIYYSCLCIELCIYMHTTYCHRYGHWLVVMMAASWYQVELTHWSVIGRYIAYVCIHWKLSFSMLCCMRVCFNKSTFFFIRMLVKRWKLSKWKRGSSSFYENRSSQTCYIRRTTWKLLVLPLLWISHSESAKSYKVLYMCVKCIVHMCSSFYKCWQLSDSDNVWTALVYDIESSTLLILRVRSNSKGSGKY